MTDWPKISIVTPSFNQGKFLEKTISSVLEQDYPNLEYIIIDGGSTDNSVDIIRKYQKQLAYWISEPDRGQSDALNKGFGLASGDIFGWLNSDDLYCKGCLYTVARVRWDKTDFCYGEGLWIDAEGDAIGRYPTIKPNDMSLYYKCTLCQPTVFFKKETYRSLGQLSLDFSNSFDYEYWLRAVSVGKKFVYLPKLLACSRMHLSNKTLSQQNIVQDDNVKLSKKYFPDGRPIGVWSAQNQVVTEEYSRYREYWLHKRLNRKFSDFFWKMRHGDGWIDKRAICLVRSDKIENYSVVFTVMDYMLPVTVSVSTFCMTKTLTFYKQGVYTFPFTSLNLAASCTDRTRIVFTADKLLVKVDLKQG